MTDFPDESKVDVLIVGAGPAGLMCANALKSAGVDVRVIDKRPDRVVAGHADGIQPRTIEVMDSYGLADRLLREGNHMYTAVFYNPGPDGGIQRTHKGPDVNAPSARFPFKVTLNQGAIEALFLDALKEKGCVVERPVLPTSLNVSSDAAELEDSNSYPVRLVAARLDSSSSTKGDKHHQKFIRARYLVGADGAHSWVRQTLGIRMEGESTDFIWGVLDLVPVTDFPDIRNRCNVHSLNGACMIIPREGDMVRLYLQLGNKEGGEGYVRSDGRIDRSRISVEKLIQVANKTLAPFTIRPKGQVEWWTLYQIGQRVASAFSAHSNRVFIMGDACHTHSPKAGQGMNASINDAHNLAWKLAHVLRSRTHPHLRHLRARGRTSTLLSTYEQERRRFALDLIAFDRKWSGLFSGAPWTTENTEGVTHEEFLGLFQAFGGFMSGIGISYVDSALSYTLPNEVIGTDSHTTGFEGVDIHQGDDFKLLVGRRVAPHTLLQAADWRPRELQDLLPSDARWKLLVFAGDVATPSQGQKLETLAKRLGGENGWYRRLGGKVERNGNNTYTHEGCTTRDATTTTQSEEKESALFDILCILSTSKEDAGVQIIPPILCLHWSKVLIDCGSAGRYNNSIYRTFGIGPSGAFVVVRPDGYVAAVVPLEAAPDQLEDYFSKLYMQIS